MATRKTPVAEPARVYQIAKETGLTTAAVLSRIAAAFPAWGITSHMVLLDGSQTAALRAELTPPAAAAPKPAKAPKAEPVAAAPTKPAKAPKAEPVAAAPAKPAKPAKAAKAEPVAAAPAKPAKPAKVAKAEPVAAAPAKPAKAAKVEPVAAAPTKPAKAAKAAKPAAAPAALAVAAPVAVGRPVRVRDLATQLGVVASVLVRQLEDRAPEWKLSSGTARVDAAQEATIRSWYGGPAPAAVTPPAAAAPAPAAKEKKAAAAAPAPAAKEKKAAAAVAPAAKEKKAAAVAPAAKQKKAAAAPAPVEAPTAPATPAVVEAPAATKGRRAAVKDAPATAVEAIAAPVPTPEVLETSSRRGRRRGEPAAPQAPVETTKIEPAAAAAVQAAPVAEASAPAAPAAPPVEAAPPAPQVDVEGVVRSYIVGALEKMGHNRVRADVKLVGNNVEVNLSGWGIGDLLGRRNAAASTDFIENMENLAGRALSAEGAHGVLVRVDIEGFRQGRRAQLAHAAARVAQFVAESGRGIKFAVTTSFDRFAFHNEIRENAGVFTESEGNGVFRRLGAYAKARN